jgi:hypothetical protein
MLENLLRGKGIWIQRIAHCENGGLDAIVARARAASFTHVLLKVADGADPYNLDPGGQDLARELAARLTEAGIEVWGWQPVYGDTPLFKGALRPDYHLAEAECALARVEQLRPAGLRGFVVVAGGDYERAHDRTRQAEQYSAALRRGLADLPIALSAWKYPNRHPRFPWAEFRAHCDLDLPQVFWIGRHGEAAKQVETSTRRFSPLEPRLPCLPVGPAFFEHNWRPAPDDLIAFFDKAIALGLPAASLWDWDNLGLTGDESYNPLHLDFREHWNAAADFGWTEPTRVPFWLREPEPAERPEAAARPEPTPPPPVAAPTRAEPSPRPAEAAPVPAVEFLEEEFEPARPYHPDEEELEAEPELVAFGLAAEIETEEEGLPEWLTERGPVAFAPEFAPLELEEDFEPVRPYHPDFEEAEPGISFAPPAEPAEVFEPAQPYRPGIEPLAPVEPLPVFAPGVEEAAPPEPELAPVPSEPPIPVEPEEIEPARPYHPDDEELESDFDFAPAFGLAAEVEAEDEDLPEWLREAGPTGAFAPEPSAPLEPEEEIEPAQPYQPGEEERESAPAFGLPAEVAETLPAWPRAAEPELVEEEEFEPARPFSPDGEEGEPEIETPVAFGLAIETDDEDLPEWLRESEAPETEPERAVAPPSAPAEAAPEPAPAPRPRPEAPARSLVIAPSAPAVSDGDPVGRFFDALRSGKPDEAAALYGPQFSHVNPDRVERDRAAVRDFYERVLARIEGAGLVWLFMRRTRLAASVQWVTCDKQGRPLQGTDSFHLNRDGQIIYHHTSFRLEME